MIRRRVARLVQKLGDLLGELRRRRVYQVTAVYVVLAVGALEVLDILVPQIGLPTRTVETFLYLAALGLPVVFGLAWVYDLTPEGVRRTVPTKGDSVGAEAGVLLEPRQERAPQTLDPRSVAVLPFENLSGAIEAEPLAVGLHDDLLTELSRASALHVISGTSVRAFRRNDRSAIETGQALGAGTVVEGTVQVADGMLRLNIQLVDARTDAQRWAERYDRELSAQNIFELQVELAKRIRVELQARLTPKEVAREPALPTSDLDAYRLYVQGRRGLEAWGEESIRGAVRDFQRALDLDPHYAAAWSGLADSASLLEWYGYEPEVGIVLPSVSVEEALDLDPELAEAHVSRAIVEASSRRRNLPGALHALERAVELRPSYAYAFAWIGWIHLLRGDPARAVEAERTATRLDPLSPAAHVFLAEALLASGELAEAFREIVRGREIQPERALSHMFEGIILHHMDRIPEALAAFERMLESLTAESTAPTPEEAQAFRAVSLASDGQLDRVRSLLQEDSIAGNPFCLGLIHAAVGDFDDSVTCFQRVTAWGQLSTECLRYFYPDLLGPVRSSSAYPGLIGAIERSWGLA